MPCLLLSVSWLLFTVLRVLLIKVGVVNVLNLLITELRLGDFTIEWTLSQQKIFFIFSSGNDKSEQILEPVSTVTADEVPDVPNNSFLLRRSRTPSPVRKKRLEEAKNRFVKLSCSIRILINETWMTAYLFVQLDSSRKYPHTPPSPTPTPQKGLEFLGGW